MNKVDGRISGDEDEQVELSDPSAICDDLEYESPQRALDPEDEASRARARSRG